MDHLYEVHEVMNRTLDKYHTATTFKPMPLVKEAYRHGYVTALREFGIWKDGVRRVGALEIDIDVIIKGLDEKLGLAEHSSQGAVEVRDPDAGIHGMGNVFGR